MQSPLDPQTSFKLPHDIRPFCPELQIGRPFSGPLLDHCMFPRHFLHGLAAPPRSRDAVLLFVVTRFSNFIRVGTFFSG